MGLNADIFKSSGRSFSNGGLSEFHDRVCIVNLPGPFEPYPDSPAVMLVHGNLPNTAKMVPAVHENGVWWPKEYAGKVGPMMGGTYVSTSDSRLSQAVRDLTGRYADIVPLHDRWETQAEYDAPSS